jgi:hypothetical protein
MDYEDSTWTMRTPRGLRGDVWGTVKYRTFYGCYHMLCEGILEGWMVIRHVKISW